MKLETTNIDGVKYVVDNRPSPIAIYITAGKKFYCVGDRIAVHRKNKRERYATNRGRIPME